MTVVEFSLIPRVVSLIVGLDVALLLMKMVILSSLGKRSMLLISKDAASWLVMGVTCWIFGFLIPVFLVALVELRNVPSMVSLVVGFDVTLLLMQVIILALLGERSVLLVPKDTGARLIVSVTSRVLSLFVPILLVRVVKLSFIPRMIPLVVWLDVRLLLMEMVVFAPLSQSWIHVSCPSFDWLRMVFVVLKHFLIATRIGSNTLCSLECSLFGELLLIRVSAVLSSPGIRAMHIISPLRLAIGFVSVVGLR